MSPALHDGDFVVSFRVPRSWLNAGAIVVVDDPLRGRLIKRITAWHADAADLRGDNIAASTDSRELGPVPAGLIGGRVLACIRGLRPRSATVQRH